MKTCYDGALIMPSSCGVMNENEMTYVEGGKGIAVCKGFLDKANCNRVAGYYTEATGLSIKRLREEIYAHAVMYYASPWVLGGYAVAIAGVNPIGAAAALGVLKWIRSHSNPIDLGNDSSLRVGIFKTIWTIF